MDANLTEANSELIRLDELLWELSEYWRHKTPSLQLRVQLSGLPEDASLLCIRGNRSLVTLALQNIFRNAFKFSYNRDVSCLLSYSESGLSLSVSDNGIGIAAADTEKIFMPLYRADNAHTFDGYGIGLSMTQKILHLHKATIAVSSVLGQGTTFNIFFTPAGKF